MALHLEPSPVILLVSGHWESRLTSAVVCNRLNMPDSSQSWRLGPCKFWLESVDEGRLMNVVLRGLDGFANCVC